MKTGILAIAALLSGLSAHAAEGPLSLKEAIRYAVEHSLSFDSERKTRSIRELQYRSSIAKLLPSLDFTTTDGLQNNIQISSSTAAQILTPNPVSPWYSALNLGLTENLYDNGVSLTNIKIADLSRDLEDLNLQKARATLTLNVAAEFYRYSLATTLLTVKQQQKAVLDKQFSLLSSEYEQGFKTRSDYLRLKAQVQQAEIDQISAQNDITHSEAELRRLLGVSYQTADSMTFAAVPVQRERKVEELLPKNAPPVDGFYDAKITRIQEEINDKTVLLTERNYWPQLFVTSGIAYSNQNYLNSNQPFSSGHQLSWNALLTVQYNIWDWGTRKRDIEVAEYNRDIQGNTLHQNLLDINATIAQMMGDVARISRSFALSRELLTLEEESNRDVESQYREGKVTYLDLITSLNSLLDAKVQFDTSYFDALQSHAKYKYYEGTLYDTLAEE